MIAYHIDRNKTLSAGMTLELQPSGLSYHGENYLRPFNVTDIENVNNAIIEHVFEEVRLAHFPDKPSRFTSLFGCMDWNNINQWGTTLRGEEKDPPIWVIETDSIFIADASLLRCLTHDMERKQFYDLAFARQCALSYWSGAVPLQPTGPRNNKHTSLLSPTHHLSECLIQLPARVLRRF